MAEGLLTALVRKLTEFAVEKAVGKVQSSFGIRKEIEKLSRQLIFIQAFIEDADKKHIIDKTQMEWVKNVMDIAYQIEDAIDIFHLECPKKLPGIMGCLGWLAQRTTRISFLYKFQKEIKTIHGRIREIEEYRQKYAINTLGQDFGGQNTQSHSEPKPKLDPIGDPEIVGFVTDLDNIVKRLCDKENQNLAVVSIVGPGGMGKTTLARKACKSNNVVKSFDKILWITISQEYELIRVLKNIASKLEITTGWDVNMNANKIRKFLEERRYLIVLDDVWTEELWAEIVKVLPDKKNGSRVLFTTRIENVAKGADTTYEPYRLSLLNEEQSLELFLKNAVPKMHRCSNGILDADLKGLAKEFVKRCEGLPLAIEVLGSLLSKTQYNYQAWKKVLQTLSWQNEGCERIDIIAASYEHLPLAKKLCFLYFAAFPEDTMIDAKSLIRIWVAERLIPDEVNRILEETAECFLEDLVQRQICSYGS
ncbi:hypothetical protein LUZ61_001579 [Rhynchospora tenuis]|uniref:Uncharacterized protein n=1 Tax=Rhynchospora tenuis TaxID=198213 RepID=A0AAD5ZHP2_9POAL|nr:hypothetical protein LUZ61_001579 [Rhynchospora tenuis]